MELGNKRYESQEEVFGENMRELERVLMLRVVDTLWMDHLDEMEHVKRKSVLEHTVSTTLFLNTEMSQ